MESMKAINFYSANHYSQLVERRKTCTIRRGDKRDKYQAGDIVWVTAGKRFAPKQRVYAAIIDRVLVKQISHLTKHDLQGENPDISGVDELLEFLESIYNKTVSLSDIVTVVYFTEIIE
ncbi:hypothetical protein SAMN04488502_101517 [Dendrosporobacter quercicolus]|uniref:ASCH domain-containing protein n=1 Tax=Dendrosporobacter quercicolus TaxID=146817 RepID=A0A1G9M0H2_9FIRM|nr:hypothetical protein SAMN04488502_101517 [Dendrosporobacter quercicolus]